MIKEIDNFYLQKEEPIKSCLLALKEIILSHNKNITAEWKYGMPFFSFKGKMFCYLWVDKKTHQPYIGIVQGKRINHPRLILGNRTQIKIMLFDPNKDLPIRIINSIFKQAIKFYK